MEGPHLVPVKALLQILRVFLHFLPDSLTCAALAGPLARKAHVVAKCRLWGSGSLGSSPGSATHQLCDLGQVSPPLRASPHFSRQGFLVKIR